MCEEININIRDGELNPKHTYYVKNDGSHIGIPFGLKEIAIVLETLKKEQEEIMNKQKYVKNELKMYPPQESNDENKYYHLVELPEGIMLKSREFSPNMKQIEENQKIVAEFKHSLNQPIKGCLVEDILPKIITRATGKTIHEFLEE